MKVKKKIKIAMLGHKRIPSREGGIEIVVEELSTRMANLGYEVTCFNRRGHHVSGKEFDIDTSKIKEYRGVKIKNVFTISGKGMAAMSSSIIASIKAAFGRYDVVHFHAEGPCAMLWLPKLLGKRCVATIHGLDHQRAKWGRVAKTYIMLGEKCAVRYADEIIVLSVAMQNYFKEIYERDTNYIPNGVSKPTIADAATITTRYELEKGQYILYLGRITKEKGLKYLLESYKNVTTDKKLVIAGGASDTEEFFNELKEMSKGDERIIFTGFVQGTLLDELYSNAYIYVLPSDVEGMPLSLMEAMSYGNCCLVSDIPECADVVEDKGVVFKAGDVSDLAKKMQELCNMPDRVNRYKAEASEFVCSKYNWDDVVKKTLQLY